MKLTTMFLAISLAASTCLAQNASTAKQPAPAHAPIRHTSHAKPTPRQAPHAKLTPRQLVMGYKSCDQAQAVISDKMKFAQLDVDSVNEVTAVWDACANEVYNNLHPKDHRVTVVTANPGQPVEVKTVDRNNLAKIHDICVVAARAYFAGEEVGANAQPVAKAVVTAIDVATDSGRTDCDSFIHGAKIGNPLIVLAPSIISGSGISMRILSMIGAGQTAGKVQAAVDELGLKVKESIAKTAGEVVNHPTIYLLPQVTTAPGPIHVPIVVPPTPPSIPGVPDKVKTCVFTPWHGCF